MKSNLKILMSAVGLVFLTGCVPPSPTLTPLQIQSLQTREYGRDKAIVFASVMSVFQDLGYIVNSADLDTGLITTESPATSNNNMLTVLAGVTSVEQTRATAFIEQIGGRSRVRLNFVASRRDSGIYGQTDRQDTTILDAAVYQNAFERIENAIFVRRVGN